MDPGILIPVKGYGGIERLVETFAVEYTKLGHEVHLLVTTGSSVEGCIMHPFGKEGFPPNKTDARIAVPVAWKFLWKNRDAFDLIHNFGRLAYLFPLLNRPVKKIMTYQREIHDRNIRVVNKLKNKNLFFTACSADLLSRIGGDGNWKVVYNAINFSKYSLMKNVAEDAPLIFLGRLERVKGCHTAINIAKKTGQKLIIAGNISPLSEEIEYFANEIRPHIDDKQIVYVGALNDEQKNYYLGAAKAMIFPIEWKEPFGIVMIEAMACGTPVIGFNMGSVGEVIDEGITGFKVNNSFEMQEAVKKINTIDRVKCREQAKKRFDAPLVALDYMSLLQHHKKKIVIVTTGQPTANPRVLKEYDVLVNNGYKVKVLYTYSAEWSYKIDEEKFRKGIFKKNSFIMVGGNPFTAKASYFVSRAFYKIMKIIEPTTPFRFIKKMLFVRSSFSLWQNAKKHKADLYIAHYLGALPAAVKAAAKHNAAVIFDAEDFHRGEEAYFVNQIKHTVDLENELLPKVDLITTASPLITGAYQKLYPSKKIITINNVFGRKYLQDVKHHTGELRLFWFSQYIGIKRGLELVVDAVNLLDFDVSLNLLGNLWDKEYAKVLLKRSRKPDKITIMKAMPPEKIFSAAADFDIGLATEIPYCENRNICLTNKIFTYLLAGNCILASDTAAQANFLNTYKNVGLLYKHNDPLYLANQIRYLNENRHFLNDCRQNALQLAETDLNWENESQKLVEAINEIILK